MEVAGSEETPQGVTDGALSEVEAAVEGLSRRRSWWQRLSLMETEEERARLQRRLPRQWPRRMTPRSPRPQAAAQQALGAGPDCVTWS